MRPLLVNLGHRQLVLFLPLTQIFASKKVKVKTFSFVRTKTLMFCFALLAGGLGAVFFVYIHFKRIYVVHFEPNFLGMGAG